MWPRASGVLAGLWAGVLLCLGAMAAPAAFATLVTADAARVAGRLFAQEAYLSLLVAVLLIVAERAGRAQGAGSVFGVNLQLLLGTLFCTVAGYFAVQPMMAAARAGQGPVSFAVLHGVSAALFCLKGLLVLVLAWRLSQPGGLRTTATS